MAYAVFKTGGKQYRVQKGDTLDVEKIDAEVDSEAKFDEVLLVNDGSSTTVGAPFIDGAVVTAKVVDQFRGKKSHAIMYMKVKTKRYKRTLKMESWSLKASAAT
jgi:large subunit ribosomal protein L21